MQSLYTLDSISNDVQVNDALTILRKQVEQSRQLFVYLVYFLTEVARYSETDARQKASKHLPSADDLNVNTKIAGNELLWKIIEEPSYKSAADAIKPQHFLDSELLKKTYLALANSEEYKEYVGIQARDKKGEREILQFIFSNLMLPNEDFINHLEEQFINWDDDAEMMNVLMLNFLQKPQSYDFGVFVSKDKMDFARDLLQTTIDKKAVSMELLKPKLENWDADRIATLYLIIIHM